MMLRLVTLVLLAVLRQAAGGPGFIQGNVCEVTTCKPVAGARLVLSSLDGVAARSVTTDLSGAFRFQQLAPGKYRLQVDADNHALVTFLSVLELDGRVSTDWLKIEMRAMGVISGRALDEAGEPLTGARVEAMRFGAQGSYPLLTPAGSSETDDRGEYRITSLNPGEYYVRIVPPVQLTSETYPITYYPNTTDVSIAAKVMVEAGGEISGIEPRLATRGVKVSGRIVRPEGDSLPLIVRLLDRASSVFVMPSSNINTMDETVDRFELRGVAPGSYYLYAVQIPLPTRPRSWTRIPVEVGDRDIENLSFPLVTPGSVKGRIIISSDAKPPDDFDLGQIRVSAAAAEIVPTALDAAIVAQVAKDGTFQAPAVPELNVFVNPQLLNGEWFATSALFDGRNVLGTAFSVTPGAEHTLDITISNRTGSVIGIVKDRLEKPVPAARLVLLPDLPLRANRMFIRTGVAIERGEFTLENIPPGDYTIFALPDEDRFTPSFLRVLEWVEDYERFGQPVRIQPGQTARVDLTVAPVQ